MTALIDKDAMSAEVAGPTQAGVPEPAAAKEGVKGTIRELNTF